MSTSSQPIAVITGGAGGIGRQLATDLLARGYRVVIGDLDQEATDATAAELGAGASAVRLDVTDRTNLAAVVAHVEATVGPIALWINNAGIMPTGPFRDQKMDVARAIIDINYAGWSRAPPPCFPDARAARRHRREPRECHRHQAARRRRRVFGHEGRGHRVHSIAAARTGWGTGVRLIVVSPNLVRDRAWCRHHSPAFHRRHHSADGERRDHGGARSAPQVQHRGAAAARSGAVVVQLAADPAARLGG